MRDGTRLAIHWILLHLLVAVLSFQFLRGRPAWLLLAEIALGVSLWLGGRAFWRLRRPHDLATLGSELIRERDFTSKFLRTGSASTDELVELYNAMSERLREERLLSSERNYFVERLLEAAPVAVIVLDHDARVSQVNPEAGRLLALDQPHVVGQRVAALGSELGVALDSLESTDAVLVNLQGRRMKVSAGHFFDRGFPRRFFIVEELTAELLESEREAYGRLIRTISHEVGNSVGAVVSLLDSCKGLAGQLPEEKGELFGQSLEVASARLRSLSAFINGFAEVVRLPDPELRPCDLKELLDDILILLGPDLVASGVDVQWLQTVTAAPVLADKNQLEQLLVNVFRNAIEALAAAQSTEEAETPREETEDPRTIHGALRLSLVSRGSSWRLRIRDDGVGIRPEVRDQLFVPFVSTKRDGRGLGLTLVREIATKHGWEVSLHPADDASVSDTESVPDRLPVGRGAVFSLLLPRFVARTSDAR
ncbi:MAG: PAS domain-containing protein [Thermoanaerobaculia bacterium]|nr:PAS domain-containing protein [Thermoanaerobaculia bacterium]